jgi:hypothetical protein
MASFNTALDNLVTVLRDYPALVAFSQAKWGKDLTVKRLYKKRTEIGASELPIILVVRPTVDKRFQLMARDGTHTNLHRFSFRKTAKARSS